MTLPSSSSLTDEQLRVLCAEARGFKRIHEIPTPFDRYLVGEKLEDFHGEPCWAEKPVPDYLQDANAALELLKGKVWSSHASGSETSISVDCFQVEDGIIADTVVGSDVLAFCRAVVLAVLRAEGKIL